MAMKTKLALILGAAALLTMGQKALSDTVAPGAYLSAPSPAQVPVPAKAPILTSAEALKQACLAQCNPNLVSNLDRDVLRRRWVLAQKAWRIQAGLLDVIFLYQAHLKNADAYQAIGDAANAKQ